MMSFTCWILQTYVPEPVSRQKIYDCEVLRRQNLREQVLEKKFAQAAAQLGRAQNFLERSDILADFVNFSIGLFEPAQTSLHIADDSRGIVQTFAQTLLGLVQDFGVLFKPLVNVVEHLSQLLLDRLSVAVQDLAELSAQFANLLLHQCQRRVVSLFLEKRL